MNNRRFRRFKIDVSPDGTEYIIRMSRKQFEQFDPNGQPDIALRPLSPRQEVVLELVRAGKQNKEIADLLHISVRTVKYHMRCLFDRFGVDSRTWLLRPVVRSDRVAEQRGNHEEKTSVSVLPSRRAS
jgi:DNA-binding NarL/FixJ family response regulator